jgi:hypothetical protein
MVSRYGTCWMVLLLGACSGERQQVETGASEEPGEPVATESTPAEEPDAHLTPAGRALCADMAEMAHEAYGGRPTFLRGAARLRSSAQGRVYPACTVTVTVDHFSETLGAPQDILERVRRGGWSYRSGGDKLPAGELAYALERDIDLCFVRWFGESHPDWQAERAHVHFTCAVTDSEDVAARDPG